MASLPILPLSRFLRSEFVRQEEIPYSLCSESFPTDLGQDFLQASKVLPHQPHSPMSRTLLCALLCSRLRNLKGNF